MKNPTQQSSKEVWKINAVYVEKAIGPVEKGRWSVKM